jgi:hypothetical protein
MAQQPTIAHYLLQRLQDTGIEHVFGLPGDYVLRFYDVLAQSSIQHIGTTREDTAGSFKRVRLNFPFHHNTRGTTVPLVLSLLAGNSEFVADG